MKSGMCWAAAVGNCSGRITDEHVVTKNLFRKKRITIDSEGVAISAKTPQWLKSNKVELPLKRFTVNMLCDTHNKILGEGPDRTAKKLMNAMLRLGRAMELPGSNILRQPIPSRISGTSYGQWLCKTHCNMMVANGFTPDDTFVFYAFGRPTPKKIFFNFRSHFRNVRVERGHVTYIQYINADDPSENVFEITLSGLTVFVSTTTIDRLMLDGKPMALMGWRDRLPCFQTLTPLGPYRILFDWSNEPPLQTK